MKLFHFKNKSIKDGVLKLKSNDIFIDEPKISIAAEYMLV